jgi:GntR family transcriptional repressor for pyruvate dehydrogenase complex
LSSRSARQEPRRGGALFKSIDSTNRSRLVRDQLEQAIASGVFSPGAKLPSERELVEQFGVSRVSVREALRSLEALGLITVSAGRGCFVSGDLLETRRRVMRQWLTVRGVEVVHLLKVRAAIEALGTEEAAMLGDPVLVRRVQEAHTAYVAAVEADAPLAELVQRDVEFHEALADASGNPLVAELTRQLNVDLSEARQLTMSPPGRPQASAREHEAIVAAVVAGDAKAASRSMRHHVNAVVDAVVRFAAEAVAERGD